MQRIGGFEAGQLDVAPTVGTDEHYSYRSKITPHYNAPRRPEQLKIGFQQRGSRNIVDVGQCAIATEAINAEYHTVRTDIVAEMATLASRGIKLPKKGKTLLFRQHSSGVGTDFRANVQQQVGPAYTAPPLPPLSFIYLFPPHRHTLT